MNFQVVTDFVGMQLLINRCQAEDSFYSADNSWLYSRMLKILSKDYDIETYAFHKGLMNWNKENYPEEGE